MKEKDRTRRSERNVVVNPELGPEVKSAIEALPEQDLPAVGTAPDPRPDWAPRRGKAARAAVGPVVSGGIAYGMYELARLCFEVNPALGFTVGILLSVIGVASAVAAVGAAADGVKQVRKNRARRQDFEAWKLAVEHRDELIDPRELRKKPRIALIRAQHAVDRIMASDAHRADVIDSARNSVELPHQLWRIAKDLRDLTQRVEDVVEVGRDISSEEGRAVLARHTALAQQAADAIESRVRRIEEYASRVAELDRNLVEARALERLGTGGDTSNVLARIAAHGDDAIQMAGLEDQAVLALRGSIEAAREAAYFGDE